jgi:hypothetical protein
MTEKKLGFGCMRFPLLDKKNPKSIDYKQAEKMVDTFLERGFTYFDTAYMYHDFTSEAAVKEILVKRHPRDSYTIATKMPTMLLKTQQDQVRIFDEQQEKVGVEFFDYYLVHNLNRINYDIALKFDTILFLQKKKEEGYIRKLGFSFHADADLLERILTEYPDFDFVQLQLNYLDWDSENIQSRKCYEIARKYNKDIVVMEPVKGGTLANVPAEAEEILKSLKADASIASWAVRFAASQEGVKVVLSGMSSLEQLLDNTDYMQDFEPLNQQELDAVFKVRDIINRQTTIPCTGCRYCVEGNSCPMGIAIPDYFSLYNENRRYAHSDLALHKIYYRNMVQEGNGKASACVECRKCERACPQHIEITKCLKDVVRELEQ